MRDVVIVSAVRTPVGAFQGALSSLTAPRLGSLVIAEAIKLLLGNCFWGEGR
jgi:acetyl-CoA C-acetyltransferase